MQFPKQIDLEISTTYEHVVVSKSAHPHYGHLALFLYTPASNMRKPNSHFFKYSKVTLNTKDKGNNGTSPERRYYFVLEGSEINTNRKLLTGD